MVLPTYLVIFFYMNYKIFSNKKEKNQADFYFYRFAYFGTFSNLKLYYNDIPGVESIVNMGNLMLLF